MSLDALLDEPRLYRQCRAGTEPAELLSPNDRRMLLINLVTVARWTDHHIARHTRWTDYTVARLRDELGLTPNVAGTAYGPTDVVESTTHIGRTAA